MKNKVSNGSVLLLVIIYMMVLTTLGFAVIYSYSQEKISANAEIANSRAFYLATAGLEMAKQYVFSGCSAGFPEWIHGNRNILYVSDITNEFLGHCNVTYPDDGVTASIDAWVQPYCAPNYSDNNVDPTDPASAAFGNSKDGYYIISCSATVKTIVNGVDVFDTIKNVGTTVYASSTTALSVYWQVSTGTWCEQPVQKVYN